MVFNLAPIIAIAKIGELLSGASLSARFFMARPLRMEFPEAIYYITSKRNGKIREAVEIFWLMVKPSIFSYHSEGNVNPSPNFDIIFFADRWPDG